MLENLDSSTRKLWKFWGLALILIAAIFIAGMDVAPYLDEDEFMIVDLGRIILDPKSDWSITWMMERNEPAFVFFYIGPVINEISYRVLGEFGPRILSLLGALFAATTMLGWLRSRSVSIYIAALLSLIFLLDPIFVQSFTLGRVDGWAIGFCLLACWVLRSATNVKKPDRKVIVAGICFSISIFIWASAAFLLPLILGELYRLTKSQHKTGEKLTTAFRSAGVFILTVTLAVIILLVPIAPQFYSYFTNILDGLMVNVFRGQNPGEEPGLLLRIDPIIELFRGLKFTPVLTLLAIIAALLKRDKVLIIGILAAISMMYLTLVYLHRIQYLLPYLVALTAGLYQHNSINRKAERFILGSSSLRSYASVLMLIWVIAVSVFVRSYLVIEDSEERNRELVFQAAVKMIGPGDHQVYMSAPEFYIAGRTLGWKMFRRYGAIGDPLTSKSIKPIVPTLEYVILREWEVTENFDSLLAEEGFSETEWHTVYKEPVAGFDGKITYELRLRNLFSIFDHPYGPYKLYSRQAE